VLRLVEDDTAALRSSCENRRALCSKHIPEFLVSRFQEGWDSGREPECSRMLAQHPTRIEPGKDLPEKQDYVDLILG
jgi:hypothetical protein